MVQVSPLKMPIRSSLGLYLLPSPNTSSTNDVSTAYGVSTSSGYNSQRENSSSYTDELMYSFFANQSSGPHLDHEDLEQLDEFDLEEMDLKWQVAINFMRLNKSKGNTGYKSKDNGRRPRKQEEPKALVTLDGEGVDWTDHAEDEQENFALMAYSNSGSDTEMKKDKSGLGYGDQVHDGVLSYENEVFQSVFNNRLSDVGDSPVHDRFANVEGMHAVPPPMTGNYMPSGPDREIDDSMFTYGPKQSKTSESDTQTSNFDSCESNSSTETLESVPEPVVVEPKVVSQPKVWSDAPIIEEYESDSDDEYDNPQRDLKNKGIVDSGCSRHMTGNKAYLAEYQDYNGGPVAFGELQHFNLFSMSQMCDKKNKVLFTDTECLVLSSDFKLPDENQATIDESNKWHRRLGHVNFKNLNKLVKGNLVRGKVKKFSGKVLPTLDSMLEPYQAPEVKVHALKLQDAQATEILKLKDQIKKLKRKCKPSISHHMAWLKSMKRFSMKKRLGRKELHGNKVDVVKEGRQSNETDELNTGSGDKGGSTEELVSTDVPKTTSFYSNKYILKEEDITMAQTLIKIKEEKAKEKGVSIQDIEDSSRPARSILTLKPLPIIDPKEEGKSILEEPEPAKKMTRSDFDAAQITRDAKIVRHLQVDLQAEVERERQREKEASKAATAKTYDEVQAGIDANALFSAKL
ncbi:ribonuclease H-like domain-containing protein [Tanacetum coccineum]